MCFEFIILKKKFKTYLKVFKKNEDFPVYNPSLTSYTSTFLIVQFW